jgi:hypothetical protein
MSRSRLAFAVAATLVVVGLAAAAPAFAEFSATKLSGSATASSIVIEGGGATVTCKENSGKWTLAAKSAGSEKLTIAKWGTCTAKSSGIKEAKTKIGECTLELKSAGKGSKEAEIQGTFKGACIIEIPAELCTITIEEAGNAGLKNGLAANAGANIELKAAYEEITDALKGFCSGIKATKETRLKGAILLEGEKLTEGGAAETSLATSLAGEGKSGETVTVLEGAGINDKATLSGTNAGKATGTVKYVVYSDEECKELVTAAGEVTVKSGSIPESEQEKFTPGASYYWQAKYSGDSTNLESTSTCGKEISNVKTLTSLTVALLGEERSSEAAEPYLGEEITAPEGTAVIGGAGLNGTKVSTATGTVKYAMYSDKECKNLVADVSEAPVAEGSLPESGEAQLKAGTYYWQTVYSGDSLHQGSTSACGKEIAVIKPATSLTTSLSGEGQEGEEVEIDEDTPVSASVKLTGVDVSKATGTVKYALYSDSECKELAGKAGEVSVAGESVPKSTKVTLSPGTYYWQSAYSGDGSNYGSQSVCGSTISTVTLPVTTLLSSGEESGEDLEAVEGSGVQLKATLHGQHASIATGTVAYDVYSDEACKALVTEAGKVTVKGPTVPTSNAEKLKPGTYYWLAKYSGDTNNPAATSACAPAALVVQTPTSLATSLSSVKRSGAKIEVPEDTAVSDVATLSGASAAKAEGYVEYNVYSDSECTQLTALAGNVKVAQGIASDSSEVTLPVGTYYWQASYAGDEANHSSTSTCGSEIETVTAPVTTELTGEEQSGGEIEVAEKGPVSEKTVLHGEHASTATGTVKYSIYSDGQCKDFAAKGGEVTVKNGIVPASEEEALSAGNYYWVAEYSGDANNPAAKSACGEAIDVVEQQRGNFLYAALGDSYSSGQGAKEYYDRTNRTGGFGFGLLFDRNRCRRSSVAYPARVANALFNSTTILAENELFKRNPPMFIFRACSGAVTGNLWGTGANGGQWNEWITDPPEWNRFHPAQDLWLRSPGGLNANNTLGMPNNNIGLVTLTLGGNDAGFDKVARRCVHTFPGFTYSRQNCQIAITEQRLGLQGPLGTLTDPATEGIPSLDITLRTVLDDIHMQAPTARIRVLLYPFILDTTLTNEWIPVGPLRGTSIENRVPRGLSAVEELNSFEDSLNTRIQATVTSWAARVPLARVIRATSNALIEIRSNSVVRHQIGDSVPWVNGVVPLDLEESFHPNCLGHIATANVLLESLDRDPVRNWGCRG